MIDVGAGSGRDLAYLLAEGHAAYGLEPVAEMREQAITAFPNLAGRLLDGALPDAIPDLGSIGGPFDGVVCSAVLQHVPRAQLLDAVYAIRALLRPAGRAVISIPSRRSDVAEDGRDAYGRLFEFIATGELELLFERIGFRTVERWEDEDSLGRKDARWATFVFERLGSDGSLIARPLDRIESVLRRDRKVATYKLALLRALTDIATNRPRTVNWREDSSVAVPVDAIAEQWILYYWPLFDSEIFLPQMSGEAAQREHKLGFARELDDLREHYSAIGGLSAFLIDWHGSGRTSQRGSAENASLNRLLAKLRTVIRTGPVHHAGRSTFGESTFGWDAKKRELLIDEALWREIALMGHWIRDSLLVRWAELTSRLALAGSPDAASGVLEQALAILLKPPASDRDTQLARAVYGSVPRSSLHCVWSGRRLSSGFEVDHLIPYALWRSNDLWNLLPAAPSVNAQKRDRLPTRSLLLSRRSAILECWATLRDAYPRRFATELGRLAGDEGADTDTGFDALCEAVEVTALQRSVVRWAP